MAAITPKSVTLSSGTNETILPLGTQMRRGDDGHWVVSTDTASYAGTGNSFTSGPDRHYGIVVRQLEHDCSGRGHECGHRSASAGHVEPPRRRRQRCFGTIDQAARTGRTTIRTRIRTMKTITTFLWTAVLTAGTYRTGAQSTGVPPAGHGPASGRAGGKRLLAGTVRHSADGGGHACAGHSAVCAAAMRTAPMSCG